MDYQRVTPRARQGTTGIAEDKDIEAGAGIFITPPDRVAAVTVAVHVPDGEAASYTIETCCNRIERIGDTGAGGYWDNVFGENAVLTENAVIMLANAVTAIRVKCITAESIINVCFVG